MARPRGSAAVLEDRRRSAMWLIQSQHLSLNATARRLGCAPSSVMRWWRVFLRGGPMALYNVHRSPGRPRGLSAAKQTRLLQELRQGGTAHGYPTDLWTTRRIARVIAEHFGITYHRSHVCRIMTQCGWRYHIGRKTWGPRARAR
jgi:putative transposase